MITEKSPNLEKEMVIHIQEDVKQIRSEKELPEEY
jgi:hypothetical protein